MTPDERRKRMHAIGRALGREFRKGGRGREAVRRHGGTLLRRGLTRVFRKS